MKRFRSDSIIGKQFESIFFCGMLPQTIFHLLKTLLQQFHS